MLLATLDSLACAAAAAQGTGCPRVAYYEAAAGLSSPEPQQAWLRPQTPSRLNGAARRARSRVQVQELGHRPGTLQLFQAVRPWRWCHGTEGRAQGLVATHHHAPHTSSLSRAIQCEHCVQGDVCVRYALGGGEQEELQNLCLHR